MTNPDPGFIAIRKQIFSHFDHNTLKVCQELFGERNGEDWNGDWDLWLEKRFFGAFIPTVTKKCRTESMVIHYYGLLIVDTRPLS